MEKTLIKGGTVVTASSTEKYDILIEGEKIARLAKDISAEDADQVIDADGKYIIPGMVEPHMHIKAPLGGVVDILDFSSVSKCAAFGGVTTFMDFSSTLPGMSLEKAVDARLEEMEVSKQDYSVHCKVVNLASKKALVDEMQAEVTLDAAKAALSEASGEAAAEKKAAVEKAEADLAVKHQAVAAEVEQHLEEIKTIVQEKKVPTFKLFMTYRRANVMIDDVYMLQVLAAVRDAGGRCGFHAESNAISEYNDQKFAEENHLGWDAFPESKPAVCEEEAVRRVLYYAEMLQAPVYFFHISTKGAVEEIRQAKKRGVDVIAETCTHYLTLTKEKNTGKDGILYLMSPPLRSDEDQKALWEGLADGTLSLVTSDNCTFPRWMKEKGLDRDSNGEIIENYTKVISGVSGIEERLGLVLSHVKEHPVNVGEISMEKLVAICCENPARIFGCYPQKGTIAEGNEADLVILDLQDKYNLGLDELHYPVYGQGDAGENGLEYAVFDGLTSGGRVIHTIRRGEFLVKDKTYVGDQAGNGRRICRSLK